MAATAVGTAGIRPTSQAAGRNTAMEGVRALAVILVFFVHFNSLFSKYLPPSSMMLRVSRAFGTVGHMGVDLFFLLSGVLIYGILLRRRPSYWKFEKRRFQRIYPAFAAVFMVYLLLSVVFPAENKIRGSVIEKIAFIVANFFLLPGVFKLTTIISVAWTLSYEFCFYLAAPWIVTLTRLRTVSRPVRLTLLICLWAVASIFLPMLDLMRMQMFFAGMLLCEVTSLEAVSRRMSFIGEIFACLSFVGAVILANFVFVASPELSQLPRSHSFYPMIAVLLFVFGAYSFQHHGRLHRVLSWQPLQVLGQASYSYYLIHGLTLKAIALAVSKLGLTPSTPVSYGFTTVVSFAVTCVSTAVLYRFIERPFSFPSGRTQQSAAPPSEISTNASAPALLKCVAVD